MSFSAASAFVGAPREHSAPWAIDTPPEGGASKLRIRPWIVLRQRPMSRRVRRSGRQHSLDALAHAARHHRRGAAGADGHHHIAAIDDGGKMKVDAARSPSRSRANRPRLARADIAGPVSPAPAQESRSPRKDPPSTDRLGKLDPRPPR